jgi:hypothetical protein
MAINRIPAAAYLAATRSPIQWVPGALSLGVRRPGHEADHLSPSGAEAKEYVELYLYSPSTLLWRVAHLKRSTGTNLPLHTFTLKDCRSNVCKLENDWHLSSLLIIKFQILILQQCSSWFERAPEQSTVMFKISTIEIVIYRHEKAIIGRIIMLNFTL